MIQRMEGKECRLWVSSGVLCPDFSHRWNPGLGQGNREDGEWQRLGVPILRRYSRKQGDSEILGFSKVQDQWNSIGWRDSAGRKRLSQLIGIIQLIEGTTSSQRFLLLTRPWARDSSASTCKDWRTGPDNIHLRTFPCELFKTIQGRCKSTSLLHWYSVYGAANWPQAWGKGWWNPELTEVMFQPLRVTSAQNAY